MDPSEIEAAAELAGKEAAHETEQAVKDAASDLANALERAEERAENAEETADALADAMLENERMREIAALREQVNTWQTQHENDRATIQTLESRMAALEASVSTPPSILAPVELTPQAETPEPSSLLEEVQEAVEEVTDPATATEGQVVVDVADPVEAVRVRPRRRFLR